MAKSYANLKVGFIDADKNELVYKDVKKNLYTWAWDYPGGKGGVIYVTNLQDNTLYEKKYYGADSFDHEYLNAVYFCRCYNINGVVIYHGTRFPVQLIMKYGIVGMSYAMRGQLFNTLITQINNQYKIKVPRMTYFGNHENGAFVSDKYSDAEQFAINAPSIVADKIHQYMTDNCDYGDQRAKIATLSILDKIGCPKILECRLKSSDFVSGTGGYGSVVKNITADNIISITTITYKKLKKSIQEVNEEKEKVDQLIASTYGGTKLLVKGEKDVYNSKA